MRDVLRVNWTMVAVSVLCSLLPVLGALATPVIYDGRAPFNYTKTDFDGSVDPYLTYVQMSSPHRPI